MPGFFITNTRKAPDLCNYEQENCVQKHMQHGKWSIQWNVLDKYMDDKIFEESRNEIIILDGVILNKNKLIKKHNCSTWLETVLKLKELNGNWFELLRGSFAGAIYDKVLDSWTCFTDQCGAHMVLSYAQDGQIAFGSQLNYFSDWMKLNNIKRKIDNEWKRDILCYGTMRESYSIIAGVKRVYPGHYVYYNNTSEQYSEKKYYMISKKNQSNLSNSEIINELDRLFHNAIRSILDKDEEYGYKTIVDISGGLDSRMNALIAKEEAQHKDNCLLGITYAQKNSDDDKISHQVAEILNIESLFYSMDNADFLKDIDKLVFMNGGFNYYFGITAGQRLLSYIENDLIGIEVWGLLGDMYEGTYSTVSFNSNPNGNAKPVWSPDNYRLTRYFEVPKEPLNKHTFEDDELLWFYARGMLAGMNTGLIRQNYVEPLTPYGDVDFMNFYFSIPYRKRVKDHICRRWLIEKYPVMANVPYSGTGVSIKPRVWNFISAKLRRLYRGMCHRILGVKRKEWSMNPFENWYKENENIRGFIDNYYNENISFIKEDEDLKLKVSELFKSDAAVNKLLAVTVISAVKQYIV